MNFAADFESFWRNYPRKVGKLAAQKAYEKARKHGAEHGVILNGIVAYMQHKPAYADYAHPSTWLNQGRWLDEWGNGNNGGEARAAAFVRWYTETHGRLVGVPYVGCRSDQAAALEIVGKLSDQEARDAATVWFGMDDPFATNGTRTIPKFASRASDCLLRAKKALGVNA